MNNFTLFTPTKIRFGKGQIAKLSSEIPKDAKVHHRRPQYPQCTADCLCADTSGHRF